MNLLKYDTKLSPLQWVFIIHRCVSRIRISVCDMNRYSCLLHEWKFFASPIGLNRGWAKKYNAIATSDDVIRGKYNVSRSFAPNFYCSGQRHWRFFMINATYVFFKHSFHEIHVIKQLFYFFLGKYDGLAPLEKQHSPRPSGSVNIASLGELSHRIYLGKSK